MNRLFFLLALAVTAPLGAVAQTASIEISLDEAIGRARLKNIDAAVALNELRAAYWEYRSFRADLLPEVKFEATVPSYRKQYSTYMGADGNYSFVATNWLDMNASFSVSQKIWPTGGSLSISSQTDFLRQFEGGVYNRFMSIPIAVTLNQPVFGVNTVRWNRRIEPVRYAEAKAAFLSATENVAMQAVVGYFKLLLAREEVAVGRQNLDNAVRLHNVAVEKRRMGQISQNDLLQMELNELSARSALTEAESASKSAMFELGSFLDFDEEVEISVELPKDLPEVEISYDDALAKALDNNKFSHNIRRRQLEADYSVAIAKGNLREINLYASFGTTGTNHTFSSAYENLRGNQVLEIGVKIPLVDWGKRRGNVKVANSNREVVKSRIRKEENDFRRELFILVERFNNQREQLKLAQRSTEIADRRYATNVETYLIGKISTLDLNDSQVRKDESRQDYINQLYKYWLYYYQLRSLTLWDYSLNCPIDADIARLVK